MIWLKNFQSNLYLLIKLWSLMVPSHHHIRFFSLSSSVVLAFVCIENSNAFLSQNEKNRLDQLILHCPDQNGDRFSCLACCNRGNKLCAHACGNSIPDDACTAYEKKENFYSCRCTTKPTWKSCSRCIFNDCRVGRYSYCLEACKIKYP